MYMYPVISADLWLTMRMFWLSWGWSGSSFYCASEGRGGRGRGGGKGQEVVKYCKCIHTTKRTYLLYMRKYTINYWQKNTQYISVKNNNLDGGSSAMSQSFQPSDLLLLMGRLGRQRIDGWERFERPSTPASSAHGLLDSTQYTQRNGLKIVNSHF